MSITVKTAFTVGDLAVTPYKDKSGKVVKGVFEHTQGIVLYGTLSYKGVVYSYFFNVSRGYVGNFASSPDVWLVQKIVPSYVIGDPVYNSGFDLHDWLYSVKGLTTSGQQLTRSEVDDIARGIMRESPTLKKDKPWVARMRCSIMDMAVGLFACGKRHWGNDSYNSKDKATFRLVPLEQE